MYALSATIRVPQGVVIIFSFVKFLKPISQMVSLSKTIFWNVKSQEFQCCKTLAIIFESQNSYLYNFKNFEKPVIVRFDSKGFCQNSGRYEQQWKTNKYSKHLELQRITHSALHSMYKALGWKPKSLIPPLCLWFICRSTRKSFKL